MKHTNSNLRWMAAAATAIVGCGPAIAADQTATSQGSGQGSAGQAPRELSAWVDSMFITGGIDVGATMNPSNPDNGINFGHLFTDKANQVVLNQFFMTLERAPDPHATTFDVGFAVSGSYGMDSQFTHYLGLADQATTGRNSFDLLEGYVDAHAPILTGRGVDLQLGFFSTPLGYEVTDPLGNFFYSKSYIFNFGLPRKHTGLLTITHANSIVDLYLGYTTGVNTSVGPGGGYNDGQPHILGGFGLNLGRVTVQALTHIGPEDPAGSLPAGVDIHRQLRYLNDVTLTWRVTDKLMSVTELNYIRDDGFHAQGGGVAEYLLYPLSPIATAGLRAEFWRDAQGFWVRGYPGNLDYLDNEEGLPNGSYNFGPATYGEITFGLNIAPRHLPGMIAGLTVRPEVRYDRTLAGATPFGSTPGTDRSQVTVGVDVVVPLTFRPAADEAGAPDRVTTSSAAASADSGAKGGAGGDAAIASHARAAAAAAEDVPPSVSVITAAQIDTLQPRTLEDLNGLVPNLQIGRTGTGPGSSAITMRGLGYSGAEAGETPAVAVVVDDVVIGTNVGQLIDPFDAASIAVERGRPLPEQGADGIAGLIEVRRARPTRAWGLDLEYALEQGFHTNLEQGVLNVPVGQTAGLSISGSHRQSGGYLNNIYTGDGLYGADDLTTGNIQFDWNITPRLDARLEATVTAQNGEGTPLALGDPLAARLLGPALKAAIPGLQFNAYGSPYIPGVTTPLGVFTVANDYPDQDQLTSQIYSLDLAYDLPAGRFTWITAFFKQNTYTQQDFDGGCAISDLAGRPCSVLANPQVGFLHVAHPQNYAQFSEDLRYARDFGDRAGLSAGLYYVHDELYAGQVAETAVSGVPPTSPYYGANASETTNSVTAYALLNFDVTRRLRLTGGVRYIGQSVNFEQAASQLYAPGIGPQVQPLGAFSGVKNGGRVVDNVAADYRLTDSNSLYASQATGYRPGGFLLLGTLSEQAPGQTNYDPADPRANYSGFNAETDDTFELGSKNRWLGGALTVNLAGFFTEDSDRQQTEVVATPGYGPGSNVYAVNVPKVEIAGAEIDVSYKPPQLPGLVLSGSGGYQNARITSGVVPGVEAPVNPDGTAGAPGSTYDLAGLPLERVAQANFLLAGEYAHSVAAGVADLYVDYRWTDRYALGYLAGQPDCQPAFGLVDISLRYTYGSYALLVSAKNLFNQVFMSSAIPSLFVHGWGDPRRVQVGLQARF